ncbi:DNA alkylation repair protein [Gracilimonas sp.]|uniref:DNA alkylation repair protein n=1 Tax=Gracilimonas sp. TaxID=1974203 RepID=UPI003BA9E5A6
MSSYKKPTDYFDEELAKMLAEKISLVYTDFNSTNFIEAVRSSYKNKALKQRVELIADHFFTYLPDDYSTALGVLMQILGPENPEQTGMFTNYYWLMPVAKFVEKFGLNHFQLSVEAIEEITKRNTGEYAIRPFIEKYPRETVMVMKKWAKSDNFHLRRLASEGLRPKLPWAPKLDLFIGDPSPVFDILTLLKEDEIHFVKKSVANHITDYFKVNPHAAQELIGSWQPTQNEHTQWIIYYATRKVDPELLKS